MRKIAFEKSWTLGEILTVIGFAVGTVGGQTSSRQVKNAAPQIQTFYNSPEYEKAYRAAELTYKNSRPAPYIPYPWNPKKPFLWVGFKEKELGTYTLDLDEFRGQLDKDGRTPRITGDPEKLAQLSQIQSKLTEENLNALNVLVGAIDLSTFFIRNHRPDIAELWTPWQLPEEKSVLDGSKMEVVHKFVHNIIECLSESQNYHVQFSKSSKFSNVVPLGADGTPMSKQDAAVFWQFYNNAPVNKAIESLFDSLHTAQIAAAKEGLLNEGSQNGAH